ncbi:hypothetical protein OH779_33875 [Actinacidiphila glaucinigra]|uniref:hypothetical protein n=1 Tax=Actinacidiphila glaucinigra TaxID=235986 RepID=UPI00387018CA
MVYEPEFVPTHVAPSAGLPTWRAPDDSSPSAGLDPLLPVRVTEHRGDWARIVCSNGWSAWVDGRLLITVPQGPPAVGGSPARTADARPLLGRLVEALGSYRSLVQDLAAGRIDLETFDRGTSGIRIGAVVDGDAVWLFDAEHDRWCYCDGTRMATYAASSPPDARPGDPGPPPPAKPPVGGDSSPTETHPITWTGGA